MTKTITLPIIPLILAVAVVLICIFVLIMYYTDDSVIDGLFTTIAIVAIGFSVFFLVIGIGSFFGGI